MHPQTRLGLREAGFSITMVKLKEHFVGALCKPRHFHCVLHYFQISEIFEKHSVSKPLA